MSRRSKSATSSGALSPTRLNSLFRLAMLWEHSGAELFYNVHKAKSVFGRCASELDGPSLGNVVGVVESLRNYTAKIGIDGQRSIKKADHDRLDRDIAGS